MVTFFHSSEENVGGGRSALTFREKNLKQREFVCLTGCRSHDTESKVSRD